MKADFESLTRTILASRKALLADYAPDKLHDLRVAIRRVRTGLTALVDGGADEMRAEWDRIATRTNDARDWDVLTAGLSAELTAEEFASLRLALEERRAIAHNDVLQLLRSSDWVRTLRRWGRYLAGLSDRKRWKDPGIHLAKVERRLEKAAAKALEHGTDKEWHKLRITVKELRYTLDARLESVGSDARLGKRIGWCKQLQEVLGDWHDRIVHRDLLDELQVRLGRGSDHPGIPLINSQLSRIDAEADAWLLEARELLDAQTKRHGR